ncbi:MAG: hypothetical protein EAY65_04570 [Alphaproteobacteria bacterium]|nr:MAG: hypothetical protein EAY65_04570 [Alphaproteobacteria bacterium]
MEQTNSNTNTNNFVREAVKFTTQYAASVVCTEIAKRVFYPNTNSLLHGGVGLVLGFGIGKVIYDVASDIYDLQTGRLTPDTLIARDEKREIQGHVATDAERKIAL